MKYIEWVKFSSIVSRAMAAGAPIEAYKASWDISMGCSNPHHVELASRRHDDPMTVVQHGKDQFVRFLDLEVPCRKCERCLSNRRLLWRERMVQEISNSNRSWFGTFTIRPHDRFIFSLHSGSRDYHASHKEISKAITRYFKRLRKAGYKFRYALVAEAHKDGYPHLHCLIHEVSLPIPKSRLEAEWPHGFTRFKLVEDGPRAAYYVCKYLAKHARTRIRASQRYGRSGRDFLPELIALASRGTVGRPVSEKNYTDPPRNDNVDGT